MDEVLGDVGRGLGHAAERQSRAVAVPSSSQHLMYVSLNLEGGGDVECSAVAPPLLWECSAETSFPVW